jgi:hypothetical protein
MDWSALIPDAPFDWALIPVGGNKRPIDPATGDLMDKWQKQDGFTPEELTEMNGVVKAVGLMLGPPSGGILAVDFDGPEAVGKFNEVFNQDPLMLPSTVGVTSGKEQRGQRFFLVDQDWWPALKGRKAWNGSNGKTCLELRWAGHQSVIAGAHPETKGYSWLPNSSPADIDVAAAPDWLLEPLVHQEQDLEPIEVTAEDARRAVEMLDCIDPQQRTSYDDWLAVGMALHNTDPGLLTAWVDWARPMDNFDEAEHLRKWESFGKSNRTGGRTIRSLHFWAKEGGYKETTPSTRPTGLEVDPEDLPLNERIDLAITELLDSHLANDAGRIDAAFAEIWKLGVSRDRGHERMLMLWAEQHGLNINDGAAANQPTRGRVIGKSKEGKGLRQQLPGFCIDKDLHLLVADAGGGKTSAMCELATVMTARDKGFLDHQAPRVDPSDDPRTTALVIASDGEGSAYSMWEDYLGTISAIERGANIEIWAQDDDTNEQPWNVSLHNLERLIKRLEDGDVCIVLMDTANAIFRGAGINVGTGPIEAYLRLLKQIVCRHCSLWISQHTNRQGGASIKGIGGHPAFQEVPSGIHLIEVKDNADGQRMRVWHCLKLRGSNYRRFSYVLEAGELKVTDGHYFQNCREQLLITLDKQITGGGFTSPSDLIRLTGRPQQSVYNALDELRSNRLIKARGRGFRLTAAGQRLVQSLRVESDQQPPWAA